MERLLAASSLTVPLAALALPLPAPAHENTTGMSTFDSVWTETLEVISNTGRNIRLFYDRRPQPSVLP